MIARDQDFQSSQEISPGQHKYNSGGPNQFKATI